MCYISEKIGMFDILQPAIQMKIFTFSKFGNEVKLLYDICIPGLYADCMLTHCSNSSLYITSEIAAFDCNEMHSIK